MPLTLDQLTNDVTEHIVKHLNPIDIIELSFCSSEWSRLLKSFKIHIKNVYVNLKGFHSEPSSGLASIILGFKAIRGGFVHFFFYDRTQEQIDELAAGDDKIVVRVFNNETFKCRIDGSNVKIYTINPLASFYTILDFLLCLFPGPLHHLNFGYIDPKVDEIIFRVLERNQINSCNTITVPSGGTISEKLFKYLLEIPTLNCFYQNSSTIKNFKYNKLVNIRHFTLPYAEWINRRSLLCLNCETIDLGDPKLSLKDLNAFIKTWMDGQNTKLRRISINFCRGWNWENEKKGGKELLNGLNYKKWNPMDGSRGREYEDKGKVIDCTDGRDIVRSDGALCTVKCDSSNFHFVVWKYPTPE